MIDIDLVKVSFNAVESYRFGSGKTNSVSRSGSLSNWLQGLLTSENVVEMTFQQKLWCLAEIASVSEDYADSLLSVSGLVLADSVLRAWQDLEESEQNE